MKKTKVVLLIILLAGLSACSSSATKLSSDAINGDLARVKERVSAGINVNEYDKWGWTPLHWAVYYRSLAVTEFLLENGADPNLKTTAAWGSMKAGCTPLIISAYYGLPNFAEPLLKHGAKVGLADNTGLTAMHYAKQYQYRNFIELLEKSSHIEVAKTKATHE